MTGLSSESVPSAPRPSLEEARTRWETGPTPARRPEGLRQTSESPCEGKDDGRRHAERTPVSRPSRRSRSPSRRERLMALDLDGAYAQIKALENTGQIAIPEPRETVPIGIIDPAAGTFSWSVPTIAQTLVIPPHPPVRTNTIIN